MRPTTGLHLLCVTLGGASAALFLMGAPTAEAAAPAAPRDPQAIYDKLCKSCHGEDGKGVAAKATTLKIDAELLDLGRPGTESLSRDERKTIVLEGKDKMPAYKSKVKEDELDALLDLAEKLAAGARAK